MLCMNQDFVLKILKQHLLKQPLCGFQGLCCFSYQMNKKSVSPVGLSHAMFSDYLSTEVCHPVLLTREIETCESPPVLETQHPRPAGDIYYAPEARVLICNAKPCATSTPKQLQNILEHLFPALHTSQQYGALQLPANLQTFHGHDRPVHSSKACQITPEKPALDPIKQNQHTIAEAHLLHLGCWQGM